MNHLSVLAGNDVDESTKAFLRLLCNLQADLMQHEGIVLVVEHAWECQTVSMNPCFDVPVCVRVGCVDPPVHADARRVQNLVERWNSRRRGGGGLRESSSGREKGC